MIPSNGENCIELQPKLKVLALHGYRQNGEVFRQKTGSFRKLVNKFAEFTFITAPHKVLSVVSLENADEEATNNPNTDEYGWFFNRDDRTFRGIRKGGPAIGFEESVRLIEETFEKHGPFDGLMGFSQGACMVGLLCHLQNAQILKCKFNFAIMASGFKSGALPHLKYYSEMIDIPSMHMFGDTDQVIPKEMSVELSKSFDNDPFIVNHTGGHYVPGSSAFKSIIHGFFKCCLLQKERAKKIEINIF